MTETLSLEWRPLLILLLGMVIATTALLKANLNRLSLLLRKCPQSSGREREEEH